MKMESKNLPSGFQRIPRDRLMLGDRDDAYERQGKPSEPTECPQCHAVFHHGHWTWEHAPENAHRTLCPACRRAKDHYPAGFVTLEGPFFTAHMDEIMRLIHNIEEREKGEHPLKRIMSLEKQDGSVTVTTTDVHLARGIGDAVQRAYQGDLEFQYNDSERMLRVHWQH